MHAISPASSPVFPLANPGSIATGLRRALPGDLPALLRLESECFDEGRRDSPPVVRRSLSHPAHEIWVIGEAGAEIDAALFLRPVAGVLRVHSIAVRPEREGAGLGRILLEFAVRRAREMKKTRLVLEVEASREELISWYRRHGFLPGKRLIDYYGPGRCGLRMCRKVDVALAVDPIA